MLPLNVSARVVESMQEVDSTAWDALRADDNPFLSHAFLAGLEATGCLDHRLGWQARHLLLETEGRLLAAAPLYLKGNSHGEFVFDHGWANAYQRAGLDYYPKLLCAVPYSPVAGPRLLAPDPQLRAALADAIAGAAAASGLSGAHVNFHTAAEGECFDGSWLRRFDWQFHWLNDAASPWPDFESFLCAMNSKKRKNIRQERAAVVSMGVRFRHVHGGDATPDELATMHALYLQTFDEKGNHPALTLEFFSHLARTLPQQMLLILAERGDRIVAGALCLRSSTTLYGRYWGCFEPLPGLHFETCYYQGIDYCLQHGLRVFEPGAQGEHKLARGFLPRRTHSAHYLVEPRFRAAVAASLREEAAWLEGYGAELLSHSPFRSIAAQA